MPNDFKASNEIAMTIEEYRAVMANRSRPVGDPYMSNWRASQTRAQQATTYESAIPEQVKRTPVEQIPELLPDRKRRKPRPPCGTDQGWASHRNWGETPCTPCLEAHYEVNRRYVRLRPGNRKKAT